MSVVDSVSASSKSRRVLLSPLGRSGARFSQRGESLVAKIHLTLTAARADLAGADLGGADLAGPRKEQPVGDELADSTSLVAVIKESTYASATKKDHQKAEDRAEPCQSRAAVTVGGCFGLQFIGLYPDRSGSRRNKSLHVLSHKHAVRECLLLNDILQRRLGLCLLDLLDVPDGIRRCSGVWFRGRVSIGSRWCCYTTHVYLRSQQVGEATEHHKENESDDDSFH